ncbi:MAG TPA: hypothetical protein VGP89_18240 [Candidatus Angelobacter sp.]|jgi:DNA-binding MarR family transcriptional regulator|nr:hypothetical protein [Candidatus Angelobacter sp.]
MKKVAKLPTPQHELTEKEREFLEVFKHMTRKRGGRRPANNEIAAEMSLDPGRVSNLLKAIELKGYFKETLVFA